MAYLTPADFREGKALWGDVQLPPEVSDARLTTEIAEATSVFDRLTGDHFEQVTGANLSVYGSGTMLLYTRGYRLSVVTTVSLVAPDGSSAELPSTQYLVRPWGLERVDLAVFHQAYRVDLAGVTYGWTATPYKVKRAVALLTYDSIRASKGKHHAVKWTSGDVEFELDPNSLTGLPEVDRIIRYYRVPARVI